MTIVGLAWRNIGRRPVRSILSILVIGLAIGSALALIALSHSIQDSSRESYDEIGDDLVVTQKGASDIFGGFIPEKMEERVAMVPGVARASGELFMFAPSDEGQTVLTQGWPNSSYLWKKVPLREGRVPAPEERRVVVLGDRAAASLAKKLGDDMKLLGETFRVIGISNYGSILNRGLAIVPLVDLQEVSYRPQQITIIHVNADRSTPLMEPKHLLRAIEALGNVTVSTSEEMLKNDRNFAILDAVSLAISIIAVTIGALNVLNVLMIATQERTREIGIFAAVGWSGGRIMASIVLEGLLMCAFGCVIGVLLSFFTAFAFPHIPAIGHLISFRPSAQLIVPVLIAAVVLCVIGSLFPAWRAVRLVPAEALRRI